MANSNLVINGFLKSYLVTSKKTKHRPDIYSYKSLHSPGHDTRFFSDVSRTSEPGFNTMKEGNCSSRTQINLHTCSLTVVMYLSKQLWYFSIC